MLFLKLFLIFTKIGTFNFGGGYAMLSLIHNETVVKNHWLTNAEFTDIVAISQSTPGPIGINCATYVGYTACLHDGYPTWAACLGSVLASLSIIWLPFIIMILISRYLITHKDSKIVKDIFAGLRPAIIGLIAAAAVLLMTIRLSSEQASCCFWLLSTSQNSERPTLSCCFSSAVSSEWLSSKHRPAV
jgi:chromate transporter